MAVKPKSSFVREAQRLGYLKGAQVYFADQAIQADPEHSSQDIVVQAGLLTEEQAAAVDTARRKSDLPGYLNDQFKRAEQAMADVCEATQDLIEASQLRNATGKTRIP